MTWLFASVTARGDPGIPAIKSPATFLFAASDAGKWIQILLISTISANIQTLAKPNRIGLSIFIYDTFRIDRYMVAVANGEIGFILTRFDGGSVPSQFEPWPGLKIPIGNRRIV